MGNFCANLNNVHLVVTPTGGTPVDVGVINQCLCQDKVAAFVAGNPVAQSAVAVVGVADTTDAINALLGNAPTGDYCNYPDHAVSDCRRANLCKFECVDGYSPHPFIAPYECICRFPKTECGGVCQLQSACPSLSMKKRRRRHTEDGEEEPLEYKWWEAAKCRDALTPCGIYGGANNGWDCIDAENDLESCGGCVIPLHKGSPHGQDCTAIPGVSDVACFAGQCEVQKCKKGYKVSNDGTSCEAL